MTPRRLLTYRDLAEEWSTTPGALRKRVERGELPVVRDGRRVRFDRQALEAHIAEHSEEAWA
jgi:excisionase family DNA binding protein